MKLQTVINHEFEVLSLQGDIRTSYLSIYADFKIKHDSGIKNNTITLQNLVRTSKELKEYIKDLVISQFNFTEFEPSEHISRTPGAFSISPRSNNKGVFYLSFYFTEENLKDPEAALDTIIGGC